MSRIEIITAHNASEFEQFQESLAESYIEAFAGPPWDEKSRCDNGDCDMHFSPSEIGTACSICGTALGPAYTPEQLYAEWAKKLQEEDAIFELAVNEENEAIRATIAHPLTRAALFERKYSAVPAMEGWIDATLPRDFVWIDDTFANRQKSPSGNLRDRGVTLARIAFNYPRITTIATRTKAAEIVSTTLRDVGPQTDVYDGTFDISLGDPTRPLRRERARSIGNVPDERTFLAIDTQQF
ncbi:MAG: hypothetical protein WAO28_02480 [Candidatus Microsaccharimonas sp.]